MKSAKSTGAVGGLIRCSGPCRKRFRPSGGVVTENQSVANALLTSDPAELGLFWFCPECRQAVLSRNISTGEELEEDYLPPEMWLEIFEFLDWDSILQVRLTCRRWKALIDGSATLREYFSVEFEDVVMDGGYRPENLPVTGRATLSSVIVMEVDSWWPAFGTVLTNLMLFSCKVSLSSLVAMLKGTPNLRWLTLRDIDYTSVELTIDVDFRLEEMTHLGCREVFDVFGQIFPRLYDLELTSNQEDINEEVVCRLIEATQGTLKHLTCRFTPYVLKQISGMGQLQLEHVHHCGDPESAVQLSQIQRSIWDLTVTASNEQLHEIGTNLRRLKEVHLTIKQDKPTLMPSFLIEMPQLTYLSLRANQKKLNFAGFKNPHMERLIGA